MAQLIGYCTANGGTAKNYDYFAQVVTQDDIEQHRNELLQKHKGMDVYFTVRKRIKEKLTP